MAAVILKAICLHCYKLLIFTVAKSCPGIVTSDSTLTPQQPDYQNGDKVIVTCDLGSILSTVSTVLQSGLSSSNVSYKKASGQCVLIMLSPYKV